MRLSTGLAVVAALFDRLVYGLAVQSTPQDQVQDHALTQPAELHSKCLSFGVDFVDGGHYFINVHSNSSFEAVTRFEYCHEGTATVLLVNRHTSRQYICDSICTTPDGASRTSVCPIAKSKLKTGAWSLVIVGQNTGGRPFAYQRDFHLTVGPQYTVTIQTVTDYATPTVTSTATQTVISTTTATPPDQPDIVSIVTTISPVTPLNTETQTHTRTFYRWTVLTSVTTTIVAPTCTLPPRPDRACTIRPTGLAVPSDLAFPDTPASTNASYVRRRAAAEKAGQLHTRVRPGGDPRTVTVTAASPEHTTVTVTSPISTQWETATFTTAETVSLRPERNTTSTVLSTVWLPVASTKISIEDEYTRVYQTRTSTLLWTKTLVETPSPAASSSCANLGGHFEVNWFGKEQEWG